MADLTIRDLRGDDLFPMLDIIGKLDIADKVAEAVAGTGDAPVKPTVPRKPATKAAAAAWAAFDTALEAYTRERGIRIAGIIGKAVLSNIGKVRDDLNLLLADLTGTDQATIKNLGLGEYVKLVTALVKRKEFAEAFTFAASLEPGGGDA